MKKETLYELFADIQEEYVQQAHKAKKKQPGVIWVRWGTLAACFCLMVAAALVLPKLRSTPIDTNPPSIDHPADTRQPGSNNILLVNPAEWIAIADMDVQFTHYPNLSVAENNGIKQFEADIGTSLNDFIGRIPDCFAFHSFYSVDVPADDTREKYIPHDYNFVYQAEDGGEITIAICADGEPLRDLIVVCNAYKESEINGFPVVIVGYEDSFFVQFSWENIHYDIETKNITLAQLEQLLSGLIHPADTADIEQEGILDGGTDIGLDAESEPQNDSNDTIFNGILDGGAEIGLDAAP